MKTHIINEHVKVIETEGQHIVNPYTIMVDGVEVSAHHLETVAMDRANDYALVYKIATLKREP